MEFISIVVNWGWQVTIWQHESGLYEAEAGIFRDPRVLRAGAVHDTIDGAVSRLYHKVRKIEEEERNAARENTGAEERVTAE